MNAEKSLQIRRSIASALLVFGWAIINSPFAQAQQYIDYPIVPQPGVYSFIQQNPSVRDFFQPQITGQFTHLTVFGDSYADWGHVAQLNLAELAAAGTPTAVTGRFGNGLSLADGVQYHYDLPTSSVANYAIGGATSGTTDVISTYLPGTPDLPGTGLQIQSFVAAGGKFGPADLVDITTAGGNDSVALGLTPMVTPELITATAMQTTANILGGVQALVRVGARNFTILSVGNGGSNPTTQTFASETTHMEEVALAPLAHSGVRIFFFDMGTLQRQISANPILYGFTNVTQSCLSVPACASGTQAQQNHFLSFDGIHLTTAGFGLVSRYETNQIDAPDTIAAQGQIGQVSALVFSDALFERLDAYREQNTNGMATPAAGDNAINNRLSIYLEGNDDGGTTNEALFAFGYNYHIPGGTAGLEYRLNSKILLGAAFKFSQPEATFAQDSGHINLHSYQFAGYASFDDSNWFADVVATVGDNDYRMDRPGVIDTINGETSGTSYSGGFKGGYLFDASALRVGPIIGLNYTGAYVNGYTETGDFLLTQIVNSQTADALTGSAGAQIRFGNLLSGWPINPYHLDPYLNLTAEHEFLGDNRVIETTQPSMILLPIITPIDGTGDVTYGRVGAGLSANLTKQLSAMINGSAIFAHADQNNFGISGGFRYMF